MHIFDDFSSSFNPHWTQVTTGGGKLSIAQSVLIMSFESARQDKYTDAQIDDYTMLSRSDYLWNPPLRMTIRARSSHPASTQESTIKSKGILRGTAGFGFWNKPFTMQGNIFTLPESIWFFYSAPPSDMTLVPDLPGWGWKAQVIHTLRLGALSHIIPLTVTVLHNRITGNAHPDSRWMQKFSGAHEALITDDMIQWHTYTLEWRKNESTFWVDDKLVLRAPQSPTHSLGFVAWIDNAYAVATPRGKLHFGRVASESQWLEIDSIKIDSL
ncbi:MAG TPA: family 16 glycosylhydrolase [Patescibacteria group bacterium]|nr:family 16 glycosylhydrolase [Patescibacteria group bacterium]